MAAVVELLYAALVRISTMIGLAQGIVSLLDGPTANTQTDLVTREVDLVLSDLNDPTFGLSPLHVQLVNLSIDLASAKGAILAAISDLTNGVTPVSLPVSPPAGYGYVGDSAIFNAVWNGLNSPDLVTPYGYLKPLGIENFFRTGYAAHYPFDDQYTWDNPHYDQFGNVFPSNPLFDTANILASDDLLTYMTRENPLMDCSWQGGIGSRVRVHDSINTGGNTWVTTMDDPAFQALKARLFPSVSNDLLPVWPGAAGVNLGSPVAVDVGVTITTDMDGVLVDLTSVPARLSAYTFGTAISYKALGGLAFVSDSGEVEPYQTLGFTSAIYTPKTMARASGVVFRSLFGVVGTITPWTRI